MTLCPPVFAQSIALENLVVDNQAGRIMVRVGIRLEDTGSIEHELQQGVELGLSGSASLKRGKAFWPDEVVGEKDFLYVLRYEPLTKEYVFETPAGIQEKGADFEELARKAWERFSLDLGAWSQLVRDSAYSLVFNVRLKRIDVPKWLETTLFFWSWDMVPESVYRLDFEY